MEEIKEKAKPDYMCPECGTKMKTVKKAKPKCRCETSFTKCPIHDKAKPDPNNLCEYCLCKNKCSKCGRRFKNTLRWKDILNPDKYMFVKKEGIGKAKPDIEVPKGSINPDVIWREEAKPNPRIVSQEEIELFHENKEKLAKLEKENIAAVEAYSELSIELDTVKTKLAKIQENFDNWKNGRTPLHIYVENQEEILKGGK